MRVSNILIVTGMMFLGSMAAHCQPSNALDADDDGRWPPRRVIGEEVSGAGGAADDETMADDLDLERWPVMWCPVPGECVEGPGPGGPAPAPGPSPHPPPPPPQPVVGEGGPSADR